MKEIWVQFSEEANAEYQLLQQQVLQDQQNGKENSSSMQLLKAIEREKTNLKINPQIGIHIPRKNIPNMYPSFVLPKKKPLQTSALL